MKAILISDTHDPPKGILDQTQRGETVGCVDLLEIVEKIKPKVHLFGHIHEAYGQLEQEGVHYVNASVLNLQYQLVNKPIELEVWNLRLLNIKFLKQ